MAGRQKTRLVWFVPECEPPLPPFGARTDAWLWLGRGVRAGYGGLGDDGDRLLVRGEPARLIAFPPTEVVRLRDAPAPGHPFRPLVESYTLTRADAEELDLEPYRIRTGGTAFWPEENTFQCHLAPGSPSRVLRSGGSNENWTWRAMVEPRFVILNSAMVWKTLRSITTNGRARSSRTRLASRT